jgi:hypothetical protein
MGMTIKSDKVILAILIVVAIVFFATLIIPKYFSEKRIQLITTIL